MTIHIRAILQACEECFMHFLAISQIVFVAEEEAVARRNLEVAGDHSHADAWRCLVDTVFNDVLRKLIANQTVDLECKAGHVCRRCPDHAVQVYHQTTQDAVDP